MSDMMITVPNLGGNDKSRVIEVLVSEGDTVSVDDPLITLESDKASMEIPATVAGVVKQLRITVGDKVQEGDVILEMEDCVVPDGTKEPVVPSTPEIIKDQKSMSNNTEVYAGPFVRRMAFELDIDLSQVPGSGSGGRVTIEDMKRYLGSAKALPEVDFSEHGAVDYIGMTQIQSLSAKHLSYVWQTVPQVTQHHTVDITELEQVRKSVSEHRLTMVTFMMKAMAIVMQEHDVYRRAWVGDERFCVRQYCHIGFACETPKGLVVPVCRDVDKKNIKTLALEIQQLSEKARKGQLTKADLTGSCATISSLGGIGGGHFTPIVNTPDAFILGVSRAAYQAVFEQDDVKKRYMMPISMSYDHRLIDGADGARFVVGIAQVLAEMPAKMANDVLAYQG
ncbi:2-oxo acid dehydrogenase subunit E2 [Candidatus Synchoanobacter obligatus]|uniref:Dihydrolipoamide acetyltransferase component of pyruvate dehydrogenase complex n=1 Tax=Candidatus Synchoanobacter obligatus TaxID=2919597 RepID=A0ABT1L4A3_9GAMM|nr:2-oxo acid dehydrogenase subunit E2 [Candidatus Synchoanobacter obligatus]MCP8352000.1 2-oxo acid dehydrogenase subunit E2 [Candidatus Synchoanobacter obligatus]